MGAKPADPVRRVARAVRQVNAVAAISLSWLILSASLVGCEAPAAIAHVLTGESKVPAVYPLDKDKLTVIMVEDDQELMGDPTAAGLIAATATLNLEKNGGFADNMIQGQQLVQAERRIGTRVWRGMKIADIGREVGAQRVVYAQIAHVDAAQESDILQARLGLKITVVDVATGKVLFPEVTETDTWSSGPGKMASHPLMVQLKQRQPRFNRAYQPVVSQDLAKEAGVHLARLFYAWLPPQTGDGFK